MKHCIVILLVGLLSAHWTSEGSGAPTVYGNLNVRFNDGEPFVDDQYTDQAFYFAASRNFGPQNYEQLYWLAVNARFDASSQPGIASLRHDFRIGNTTDRPAFARLGSITNGLSSAGLGGLAVGGNLGFLAVNERRLDNGFDTWVYAVEKPPSDGASFTLKASLKLTPASAQSEEATDLQFADYPTTTNGALGQVAIPLYLATSRKIDNSCHAPELSRVEYDPLLPSGLSRIYEYEFAQPFPECHTQSTKIKVDPAYYIPRQSANLVRHIMAAGRCRATAGATEQVCAYKIKEANHPDGGRANRLTPKALGVSLDTAFGGDGQVIVRHASNLNMRYWDHAFQGDKLVISAGREGPPGAYAPILVRLNADGTLDTAFGSGGVVEIPASGTSTNPRTITVDINRSLVVSGETYTASTVRPFLFFYTLTSPPDTTESYAAQHVEYAFPDHLDAAFFTHETNPDGGIIVAGASYGAYPNTGTMRPLLARIEGPSAAQPAIEYFHSEFGHYAAIANPEEILKLDTGVFKGWERTGYWFNVYPLGTPGTVPVDRFFGATFGAKSSHFYTNDTAESAKVKANPDWTFEGTVFSALAPDANGVCPPLTRPVRRIYNMGVTGAPNHQYADDDVIVAQALARGGVLEGLGAKGAFFCTE